MRDSATSISNRDSDAIHIGALYRSAEKSACESVRQLLEVGQRLYEKKQSLPHGAWLPWLAENADVLGFGQRAASRLVMARHKFKLDASVSFDEKKALQVSREIWGHSPVRGTAGTGENEWFTPPEFLELARTVLGVIDLDPASSDKAQEVVQAEQYFAKADDGLAKQWHGRVWLNPPYAQPFIAQFVAKLVAEIEAGRTTAAILLTHNYTDTAWFHAAAARAAAICFTRGRVKFYEPDGAIAAPTQGQAFFYFGQNVSAFAAAFDGVGFVIPLGMRP